jgi:amidophosphoribosyltransferase
VCGVAGVFGVGRAERLVAEILFAIQHRGQESCGVATRNSRGNITAHKAMGLVKNVLIEEVLDRNTGDVSIGHVRYPTAGSSDIANSQPHAIDLAEGPHMAICSNGDIINYGELRSWLEREADFTFKSDNDAELIGRLIAFYHVVRRHPIEDALQRTMQELKGAFATLVIFRDRMYAFRDPHGIRPLVMGHLDHDALGDPVSEGTVFASECCGFGIVGARRLREVAPGEILCLERGKPVTTVHAAPECPRHCVFELIYFSRPDSETFGERVYSVRERIGACLAAKDADLPGGDDLVVMPVPDSSNFVALGYADAKGARFGMGLLRNHYVGRTFIKPNQKSRDEGVKQKFNPLPGFFPGKRVVLVDDSIVRGTSLRKIVRMLKAAGALEVHVRIGSPRVIGSCYYGIDTPTRDELIANRMTVPETASYMCADSLKYMELGDFDGVLAARKDYCYACFDLDYIYPPEHYGIKVNVPLDRE